MKVERIPQTPPPPPDLVVITLSLEEAETLRILVGRLTGLFADSLYGKLSNYKR